MTNPEYQELTHFLTKQFDGIDRRFDGIETEYKELTHFLTKKFDGIDRRFDGIETEYQELIGFLSKKFGGINERFDGIEIRLVGVEVSLEKHRHDFKALAELRQPHSARQDRLEPR